MKLIGKKKGMTSIFVKSKEGNEVYTPVTVLEVGPCPVVQIKTTEKDGYNAIQMGFADEMRESKVKKPVAGHLKKAGVSAMRTLAEDRDVDVTQYEVGQVLTAADLEEGRLVDVIGNSKGRGFAGGMKRYGFKGHRASHGEEKHHRTNGSLTSSGRLTHVWKGKRMSGHMGNERKTIRNLKIVRIIPEKNLVLVKGSVPGHADSTLMIVQK